MARPPYTICTVRPAVATTDEQDAGLLWPLPAETADEIVLDPRDGTDIRRFVAREITVGAAADRGVLLRADAIRAQVFVTDARIAVACAKYDRGGGWIGGPVALSLNVGSRVRAARRRRGTTLVGHVRYPWLCGVYARGGRGLGGQELLRLVVEGDGRKLSLELSIGRGESATELATDLIRRAARFRLDHEEEATAEERAELVALASIPPLQWAKDDDDLAGRDLPLSRPPTIRSARLGAGAGAEGDSGTAGPRTDIERESETTLVRAPRGRPRPREPQRPSEPDEEVSVVLRRPVQEDDLEITLRPKRDPPDAPRG